MTKKDPWKVPPELAAYGTYTNYPDRAEELINSPATFKNNLIVAAMACETDAQWRLLVRLRGAGLLLHPDDRDVLCPECKRAYDKGCPGCGACEAGCNGGFDDNPCTHPQVPWGKKEKETA